MYPSPSKLAYDVYKNLYVTSSAFVKNVLSYKMLSGLNESGNAGGTIELSAGFQLPPTGAGISKL